MALEGAEQRRRHDTLPRDSLAISKRHMRAPQPDRRPAPRRSSPARTEMSIATSLAANRGTCGRKLRSVRGEEGLNLPHAQPLTKCEVGISTVEIVA